MNTTKKQKEIKRIIDAIRDWNESNTTLEFEIDNNNNNNSISGNIWYKNYKIIDGSDIEDIVKHILQCDVINIFFGYSKIKEKVILYFDKNIGNTED